MTWPGTEGREQSGVSGRKGTCPAVNDPDYRCRKTVLCLYACEMGKRKAPAPSYAPLFALLLLLLLLLLAGLQAT